MKTRFTIFGLLLVLVILLTWWLHFGHRLPKNEMVAETPTPPAIKQPLATSQVSNSVMPTKTSPPILTTPEEIKAWSEKRIKEMTEDLEKGKGDWRTPIEFYGRVVDESNIPVADAKVHFTWTDLSPTGNSEQTTTSDGNGLFDLRNTTGKNLIVEVSKSGYYEYQPSGAAFNYAGENQNFVPDQGNPVIFRLRKKGIGEALIHFRKSFSVPKDGTPIQIDLATGNLTTSSENSFRVECWTDDAQKKEGWKFDWECRISVPGGSLQIYDEQFPFLAPEDNYVPEERIDMPVANNPQWTEDVRRKFYIKTANGDFARMEFRMIAHGDHFCQIDSFFNPSGSRNLEPAQ